MKLIAVVLCLWASLSLACTPQGAHCSTASPCCPGLSCQQAGEFKECLPGDAGTPTAPTTSNHTAPTTYVPPPATVSSPPPASFSPAVVVPPPAATAFLLRFPVYQLALGRPANTVYCDPRDGSQADEYVRFVEAEQLLWQVLPDVINAYPPTVHPNSVAIEDLMKFGVNYVVKAGGSYQWFHPTYVWYISRQLMGPVHFAPPYTGSTRVTEGTGTSAGQLNQLPGLPLRADQCAALDAASQAHDAQAQATINGDPALAAQLAPAVMQTLADFVSKARNEAERQLFDLVFTGKISPNLSQAEVAAQTEAIVRDHMAWHDGFNCGTGQPPNVQAIQLAGFSHDTRHLCRALDPRTDVFVRHYVTVYGYYRETCAQLAYYN